MIIIGVIGVLGIINAFVLWCCCKVGKESDIHLEILFRDRLDLNKEKIGREDDF